MRSLLVAERSIGVCLLVEVPEGVIQLDDDESDGSGYTRDDAETEDSTANRPRRRRGDGSVLVAWLLGRFG